MLPKDMLGRYEYSDGSSNKFWQILPDGHGMYAATWGRIGTAGQGPKLYDEGEAYTKINEKISKGYSKVSGIEQTEAKMRVEAKRGDRKDAIDFMAELRKVK